MRTVTAKDVDRYPHIYLYDDEPLVNLIVTFEEATQAQEWWHVVVDLENSGFALAKVSDFTSMLRSADDGILEQPMAAFVGTILTPVTVIYEMDRADMNILRDEAYATPGKAAVILEDGDFRGVIPVGGTRSTGAFDAGLVEMAGKYGKIPERGVLSKRRKKSKKSKK